MKKFISIALALVMMMAVTVPAFAVGTVDIATKTTKADGSDGNNYSVVIPANTTIAWGAESTKLEGDFKVETHLLYGESLKVTVTSADNKMTYAPNANESFNLDFSLSGDTDFTVGTVQYPAVEKEVYVDVSADAWNYAVVGEYVDTLTFSAEIVK